MYLQSHNDAETTKLSGMSLVLENNDALLEPQINLAVPVFECCNEDLIFNDPYMTLLKDGSSLTHLKGLASLKPGTFQLSYCQVPYIQHGFLYGTDRVTKDDPYCKSKLTRYIYNRLKLVHRLLSTSGVCMVLVDEWFLGETKLILNEIFGEANCITTHILQINNSGKLKKGVYVQHQYLLVYAKEYQSCLERLAFKSKKMPYFYSNILQDLRAFSQAEDEKTNDISTMPESEISTASFQTSRKKRLNDTSYYPIYYLPKQADGLMDSDSSPRLSLNPFHNPTEIVILPTDNRTWMLTKASCQKYIDTNRFIVRFINGNYKLFYRLEADVDPETRQEVQPLTSILEEASMVSFSKVQRDWLLDENLSYHGLNECIVKRLLESYSQDGDSILVYDDPSWSFYTAMLNIGGSRLLTFSTEDRVFDKHFQAILSKKDHQYLIFSFKKEENDPLFDFINHTQKSQDNLMYIKCGLVDILHDNKNFTLYETVEGDYVICFKVRYDVAVYEQAKNCLPKENVDNHVYVFYIDDSEFCQGESLIPTAEFCNMLKTYHERFVNIRTKLL